MTPAEASRHAITDIARPPPEEFEVRVVVWRTRCERRGPPCSGHSLTCIAHTLFCGIGVLLAGTSWLWTLWCVARTYVLCVEAPPVFTFVLVSLQGNMNDMYGRAWLEGGRPQETDIHWRCRGGTGVRCPCTASRPFVAHPDDVFLPLHAPDSPQSFNWRMKFPIKFPSPFPLLHLQLWDKDIIGCAALCRLLFCKTRKGGAVTPFRIRLPFARQVKRLHRQRRCGFVVCAETSVRV